MNYLSLFNKLEIDFFKKDEVNEKQCVLFKLKLKEEYVKKWGLNTVHYGDVFLNKETGKMFVFGFKEISTNFYDSHYFYGFEFISTTITDNAIEVNESLSIKEILQEDIEYIGNIILNESMIISSIEEINESNETKEKQLEFIHSFGRLLFQKLDLLLIYYEKNGEFTPIYDLSKVSENRFLEVKKSIKENHFMLLCHILNTKIFVGSLCLVDDYFGFIMIDDYGDIVFLSLTKNTENFVIKKIYHLCKINKSNATNIITQENKELYNRYLLSII